MENYKIVDLLLIEDNQNDAELIIRALRKNQLANNLFVIDDGAEALDFFFCKGKFSDRNIEHKPRVVLLDLKLPKVNGLEIIKSLKSNPKTASIPIVILTSSQEEPDIREAYRLGANSYVVKPLDFDQFVNAMTQVGMYWMLVNKTN
jgi:two-component system, response regulator